MFSVCSLQKFTPGSIHLTKFRDFWLNTLKCSPWVADVLEHGYRIPFTKIPGQYEESNNASVVANEALARSMVLDLAEQGIVEFVSEKPWCVSPLGLVSKSKDGVVKHRLVFDASRWINLHVDPPTVKLAHLDKALLMTHPGDFQVVFDLHSAYYNVKIFPGHVQYLGASIKINEKTQYFVFKHLPFGLNSAVFAITKLWKPLTAYLHMQGIRFSIYVDDGRILAENVTQAEQLHQLVYDLVEKSGWHLAVDKSDGPKEASQCKKYLGFYINTQIMTVTYPDDQLVAFCHRLQGLIHSDLVSVKDLASILGKMISLSPSHGPSVRICSRSGYAMLESHVDAHGWEGLVRWTPSALEELKFFIRHASTFNNSPIINALTDIRVDTVLKNPLSSKQTINATQVNEVLVSDASSIKAAVKSLHGPHQQWSSVFKFNENEKSRSSGERELLAVHKLLQQCLSDHKLSNAHVFWGTDSQNLVSFLTKGSPKPWIQSIVFEILKMSATLHCVINPVHLYREDERIREVDQMSKFKDSDNWSIDHHSFNQFDQDFHFEVDIFADAFNRKAQRFISQFYHAESEAVDAFSIEWKGMAWVCPPPVSLVNKVIRRIRMSPCQGLLVVPNWPASDYFCELFHAKEILHPFHFIKEFTPYIFQNDGATNTPLFGVPDFSFFALYFNTL